MLQYKFQLVGASCIVRARFDPWPKFRLSAHLSPLVKSCWGWHPRPALSSSQSPFGCVSACGENCAHYLAPPHPAKPFGFAGTPMCIRTGPCAAPPQSNFPKNLTSPPLSAIMFSAMQGANIENHLHPVGLALTTWVHCIFHRKKRQKGAWRGTYFDRGFCPYKFKKEMKSHPCPNAITRPTATAPSRPA